MTPATANAEDPEKANITAHSLSEGLMRDKEHQGQCKWDKHHTLRHHDSSNTFSNLRPALRNLVANLEHSVKLVDIVSGIFSWGNVTRSFVVGRHKHLGVGELTRWVVIVIAVAYWSNIVRGALPNSDGTLASFVNSIVDNGAFDVFAWILILVRAASRSHTAPASPHQIAAAILAATVVLVPARLACAGALLIIATPSLLIDRASPPTTRQMRPLLFALAFEVVWMSPLVAPFHVLVGGIDARITASLLRAVGESATSYANIVNNISAGFSIAVWPQCASSFPLADVTLAFLVIVSYRGQTLRAAHLGWLAASLAMSVLLTELRLPLLTGGTNSYHWWHFGPGVTVYALVAACAAGIFPLLATADRSSTPHHATKRIVA